MNLYVNKCELGKEVAKVIYFFITFLFFLKKTNFIFDVMFYAIFTLIF